MTMPRWIRSALGGRNVGVAGVVVLLVIVFGAIEPLFLRAANLSSIVQSIGILVVLAVGEMFVVVTRNIDLSVGSTLGLAAMTLGLVSRDHPGTPTILLVLIAVTTGAVAGLFNGILVAIGEVPPIIATLGTLAVFRGFIFLIADSRQIDPQSITDGIAAFSRPIGTYFTWLIAIALLVAAAAWLFAQRTLTGRRLYAVGSNPEAASARGLRVMAITIGVFTAMGALAGLGGMLYVARFATVNPSDVGLGFELTVVSAVVIGGTNILGGSGSVVGTVLGCLLVGILNNGLTVVGVSTFWQSAAEGLIILLAVMADSRARSRAERERAIGRRARAQWTPA